MLAQTRAELETTQGAERQQLQAKIDELNRRLADPEEALAQQHAKILDLEARLERLGNRIGGDRLTAARAALRGGDFTLANDIFAEIDAARELDVAEAAQAAFGLGEVAEAQIRWADAATHYAKAARLDPSFGPLRKAHEFAWRSGDYPAALHLGADLLAFARTLDDPAKLSAALNNHALTLRAMGRYDEAEPLYREALEIDRKVHGTAHPVYATALNNLAGLLQATGQYDEAEPLFREAQAITRQVHGTAHPNYATRLNNLAELLRATGRFDEAEPLLREAQAITRQVHGTAHPDYAIDLNNLAGLLWNTGRRDEAEPLFREAIQILETALGPDHPNTKAAHNNLAILLAKKSGPKD